MPWGDYGNILFSGLLTVLDHNYDDLEYPEIERVGPYFPDIYIVNSCNLIITDRVKTLLDSLPIRGIAGYRKAVVKKIVNIDWQSWDFDSKDPLFYPKGNSPENYILKGENSLPLMKEKPEAWELLLSKECKMKQISSSQDHIAYTNLALSSYPELDIFQPENMLFVVVSERFKEFIEQEGIFTLNFIELLVDPKSE